MLSLLTDVIDIVRNLAIYVVVGAVTLLNLVIGLWETVANGVLAVLPTLPAPVTPPGPVAQANAILPVGAAVSIVTTMLAMYISFIAVRWVLRKSGVV